MKKYAFLFPLFLLSLSTIAATELSSVTNGVYLAIGSSRTAGRTNEPIQFDDPLIWMPFAEAGEIELSYPLAPEYLLKIKMIDSRGTEVAKTKLGEEFGSKFDGLHNVTETRIYPFVVSGSYRNNPDLGGARSLVRPGLAPKDLFEIKDTGVYTLEIQMQMFRPNPQSTNAWKRDLFRFPPVRIRVEKTTPSKSSSP